MYVVGFTQRVAPKSTNTTQYFISTYSYNFHDFHSVQTTVALVESLLSRHITVSNHESPQPVSGGTKKLS